MSDWMRRIKSALGLARTEGAGERWTDPLRRFIATGRQELYREAWSNCADDRLRGLLVALDHPSSEAFTDAACYAQKLRESGHREQAGALWLFAALPAATAISAPGTPPPDPERTLPSICFAAAQWARDLNFRECQAYFEDALGRHARACGDLDGAYRYLSSALGILRELAGAEPELYAVTLARALHAWGKLHWDRGEPSTAEAVFLEALALCGKHASNSERDAAFFAGLLTDNGNLRDALGDQAGAQQQYEQALAICDELSSQHAELIAPLVAGVLNNLAQLHARLGRPERAQPLFERALVLFQQLAAQDAEQFGPHADRLRARLNSLREPTPPTAPQVRSEQRCPCGSGQEFSRCHGQA